MSDRKTNHALAVLLGHEFEDPKRYPTVAGRGGSYYAIPSYCGDLDACHKVEKQLTAKQWRAYSRHLEDLTARGKELPVKVRRELSPARLLDVLSLHASARHRALALLKTLSS